MPTADTRRRLLRRLKKVRLDPTPDIIEGLVVYYDLLQRWNQKINLTALPDGDEAVDRLLVEPLVAARALPEYPGLVVDIGSGGGSPAIPLKLSAPTAALWMVEAKARKAAFLREVIRQLNLDSTVVETGRFEQLINRPELFGRVEILSVRAVRTDLKTLASLQQFLKPGGQIFLFTRRGAVNGMIIPPQLELSGEDMLVPSLQSSLVRFSKRDHPVAGTVGAGR